MRSTAGLPGQLLGRHLADRESTTYPMFDMLECGPTWDYTAGGSMLLVVASGMDAKLTKDICGRVQVMFDETQVSCVCMACTLISWSRLACGDKSLDAHCS